MEYIRVLENGNLIREVPFENRIFIIGKDPSCDICLDGMPSRQAKIIKDDTRILFYNLSKVFRSSVNGKEVRSTILKWDDVLTIGRYAISFGHGSAQTVEENVSALKLKLHNALIEKIGLEKIKIEELADEDLRQKCSQILDQLLDHSFIPGDINRDKLKEEILNEALALGPLEDLLKDDSITEIMVNTKDDIFVEEAGKLKRTDLGFTSDKHVINIISRIVAPLGRRIDESMPMVDGRLKDGSRVNAIIPPLALKGPSITIRKFAKKKLAGEDLVKFGSVTDQMLDFLKVCVEGRRNIVVSGGTGTGKTTFLNVVSLYIPEAERIITIEDSAELKLPHENLISLEARPPNIEGKGAITIRDLVRNALRMRPDRIIVGECRSGEALDMLQAMNTGHDGSLTTVHANSPYDSILRIETMAMLAGVELPSLVIRRQIASAINIIIQLIRFSDGSRKVISVSEIDGMRGDDIVVKDIFVFNMKGTDAGGKVKGDYTACGHAPKFLDELAIRGLKCPREIFKEGATLK
jgi:pilus assembly protein CpaF